LASAPTRCWRGSTATVSAELDALTFTPAVASTVATTGFQLPAFDGATTADNNATSVIASPAAAAAITAVSVPATFTAADHLGTTALVSTPLAANGFTGTAGLPAAPYNDPATLPAGPPMPELHW
jgi:hypothetical protein